MPFLRDRDIWANDIVGIDYHLTAHCIYIRLSCMLLYLMYRDSSVWYLTNKQCGLLYLFCRQLFGGLPLGCPMVWSLGEGWVSASRRTSVSSKLEEICSKFVIIITNMNLVSYTLHKDSETS